MTLKKINEQLQKMFEQGLNVPFEIERVSDEALVVRKVPALLRDSDIEQLVRDVISDLIKFGTTQNHTKRLSGVDL